MEGEDGVEQVGSLKKVENQGLPSVCEMQEQPK